MIYGRTFGLSARDVHGMLLDAADSIFADPTTKHKVCTYTSVRIYMYIYVYIWGGYDLSLVQLIPHGMKFPEAICKKFKAQAHTSLFTGM